MYSQEDPGAAHVAYRDPPGTLDFRQRDFSVK